MEKAFSGAKLIKHLFRIRRNENTHSSGGGWRWGILDAIILFAVFWRGEQMALFFIDFYLDSHYFRTINYEQSR